MSQPPPDSALCQFYDDISTTADHLCQPCTRLLPPRIKQLVSQLGPGTMKRFLSGGFFIPENMEGARVLDIGCGSGSLVFLLSKLVGPSGYVLGVDISEGMIEACHSESEYHCKAWAYDRPNFEFRVGKVQDLLTMGLGQFDALVSSGVYCTLPDHLQAFKIAAALLKPGGQFYISDVCTDRQQTREARQSETLWFMGLAASMEWHQLAELAKQAGFTCPYLTFAAPHVINNTEFRNILKDSQYAGAAWRLFKLPAGAKRGAATVTYKGNIPDYEELFPWDLDLSFKKGEQVIIDDELATILVNTSFVNNFDIQDFSGQVTTNRNQDPFQYLSEMAARGTPVEPAGVVH